MIRHHRMPKLLTAGVALALLAVACSDDPKQAAESVPDTVAVTSTTAEAETTVASSEPDTTVAETDSSTPTSDSTPAESAPVYPLTGLPITDIHVAGRPALVVKVDNHPLARPQSGINEADIVYEENVEHLTRFALVIQTDVADPVGPIRSGRTQDVDLLGSLNAPLFAWSGGNPRVTDAILDSDLREISPRSNGPFFRTKREAPHNLYSNVTELYKLAPLDAGAPPQQFQYRVVGTQAQGDTVAAAKISMDGVKAMWVWDEATSRFLRFTDGKPHDDAIGNVQVSTDNVVVISVEYQPSPADRNSPEAQTLGYGVAWVFTDGHVVKGTWTRADRLAPFTLADENGDPILLTPGRTFVELSGRDKVASVPVGTDPDSVQYP